MADSVIIVNTNTSVGASIDTRTNTGGEHRQVVILGEGAATSDALIPADGTKGLMVQIYSAGTIGVTISSTGSTVAASQYGSWSVSITSSGSSVAVHDNGGSLTVDAPLATPVFVTPTPSTTGGWSGVAITGLFASSQGIIKSAAGTLGAYYVYNANATVTYLQLFDAASAITPGTTSPKWTIGIPATSAANLSITGGLNFATGIRCVATTAASNGTAPSSGLDCSFGYK